jgi:hypothetical protein
MYVRRPRHALNAYVSAGRPNTTSMPDVGGHSSFPVETATDLSQLPVHFGRCTDEVKRAEVNPLRALLHWRRVVPGVRVAG